MDGKKADMSGIAYINTMTNSSASYLNRIIATFNACTVLIPFAYQNRVSVSWPHVVAFFTALRESNDLPIGAAGYCWGGRHVIALCHGTEEANGKPLIDVGYAAHPSNLSFPTDIENVKLPLAIDQGTKDFALNMAGVKTIQDIFEKKNEELEERKETPNFEIKVVDGAKHGFAVRCDMDNEEEAAQEQIAENHAVDWLGQWFARDGSTI